MNTILIDTNVIIEHLKDRPWTDQYFTSPSMIFTSYVVIGEILQGAKSKPELKKLTKLSSLINTHHGSPQISQLAIKLTQQFTLSHSIGFFDALIAATAIETNTTLLTLNTKHFSPIKGLQLKHPTL